MRYFFPYGEPLSAARTKLAGFFSILLGPLVQTWRLPCVTSQA